MSLSNHRFPLFDSRMDAARKKTTFSSLRRPPTLAGPLLPRLASGQAPGRAAVPPGGRGTNGQAPGCYA